jgi:hypothetical protein
MARSPQAVQYRKLKWLHVVKPNLGKVRNDAF